MLEFQWCSPVQIVSLDEETSEFSAKSTFDHPYPTTKIMWIPDSKGIYPDHQRGLPPGLAGRGAGDQAGVLAQQQQELGLLRPAHLLRLERGGSEPVGHFLHWHDLHRLGPGDGSGDHSFWFVLFWPAFGNAISVFYLKIFFQFYLKFLSLR